MDIHHSANHLLHYFKHQVSTNPDKIAVKSTEINLTYIELDRLSDHLFLTLKSQLPPDRKDLPILLALDRSPLAIAAMIAILKCGHIYVPFDPTSPDERLQYILTDAHCVLMITSTEYCQRQNHCPEINIDTIDYTFLPPEITYPDPAPNALSYIMYTSGSTGKPKGALIPQQGIIRLVINTPELRFSPDAIITQCGNIAFDASTLEIWGALLNGATLVIVPYETVIDSVAIAALLRQEKVTDAFFTVALFNQLVMEDPEVFAGLKNIYSGGDALNPNAIRLALDAEHPPENIWNAYGPTENTVITTLHRIKREDCERSSIPIGTAIAQTQCYVLDENGKPVAPDQEGELYTSGTGLALEYINKPEKTREAFVRNPFYAQEQLATPDSASAWMYKTGDRVRRLPDGTLDFIGRIDNQVKIRGFRLEPGEVEYRLSLLPCVELAAVDVFVQHGEKHLAAWCQSQANAAEILAEFRLNAPAYMVPSSLQVVDKLPLTPNGKVDKRNLPPRVETPQTAIVPCQTATEETLDTLWQTLLDLPHSAGREGHFFLLGGHSLLVVKLRQAIAETLGKDVTIADIFRHPELAAMATQVENAPQFVRSHSVARVNDGAAIPLSDEQKRLWLSCIRDLDTAQYAIPLAFELQGKLDLNNLEQALAQLSQRHHSLRLRIYNETGMPWQQVSETPVVLNSQDFASKAQAHAHLHAEMSRPFLFEDDPLFRASVLKVAGEPTFLLFNFHHAIADGWSMGVFFRELAELYTYSSTLAPLENQFTDYCFAQQQKETHADLAFWREQLQEVTPLDLPVTASTQQGTVTRQRVLSLNDTKRLQQVAIANNIGMFTLCYSALALLLSRLCGQSDIPISSIWANRPEPGMAGQIGFFANTLILRTTVDESLTLAEWLQHNQQILTRSFEHGAAPLSEVLLNTGITADNQQHPLCSVLLVLQNTEGGDGSGLQLEGCPVRFCPPVNESAKSDLLFNIVIQQDGQLRTELSFRQGICSGQLQKAVIDDFVFLLQRLTTDAHQTLRSVMTIDPGQQHQQLIDWNPGPFRSTASPILSHFQYWVSTTPNAIAVCDPVRRYTYQQLDRKARRLANALEKYAGDLSYKKVAFALERDANTVVVMLAILYAGGVYVPFDPAHPDERLNYVLEDSGAVLLITTPRHAQRQARYPEYLLDALLNETVEERVPNQPTAIRDTVAIMYTSGSTGAPKGVEVPEGGILRLVVEAKPYQISRASVVAQAGNIAFDAATLEIWGALLNGAKLVVIPYETVIDSSALAETLASHSITDAWFTVALFNQLANENPQAFGNLDNLLIGGDALTPSLVAAVLDSGKPPRQIWNGYGPTENTTFTTLHPISRQDCDRASIPIGRPISGTTCYVLSPHQNLLPTGMPGELYTSGEGVSRGYLNKAGKTAEVFVPNPFWNAEQVGSAASRTMYKTGDKVRWLENGTLEFLGRVDNQVKIRGYRLDPGEVEYQLCQLQDVTQAIVSVMTWQQQKHLVAWCVSSRSSEEVLSAFRNRAPAYMIPTVLLTVEAFPLTPNGKVDRKQLPAIDFDARETKGTPPQGTMECVLADIWQQLLATRRPCCREDNFFAIGGHSLLVIKMTDLIQQQTGKVVSVATVFKCTTLAELATHLEGKQENHDKEEALLLEQDCKLEAMSFPAMTDDAPREILLTGASGFLGIYLLETLQRTLPNAVIHCVLRGEHALQRLCSHAKDYQLTLDKARIRVIHGDLNRPKLGLAAEQWQQLEDTIESIYHCGAWVNHLHSYTTLKAANVESTLDLLRLCQRGKAKKFYYVSTLSAAPQKEGIIFEHQLADTPPMKNGYVQSKWVCEKLMAQAFARGLQGAVYRMGNITGSTQNGISNAQTNHTLNLIKGCLQQNVAPEWPSYCLDISPVDKLAQLLVQHSVSTQKAEQCFNLGWLSAISWSQLLQQVAPEPDKLRFVSGEAWSLEWVPQIQSDNALYPFKSFYLTPQPQLTPTVEHELVKAEQQRLNVVSVIDLYLRYWIESGFFDDLLTPVSPS